MTVTFTKTLSDSEAAALSYVANSAKFQGTPEEYFTQQCNNMLASYQAQRLQVRLAAVPERLTEMPSDKIAEAEQIFQIPSSYPDGINPLPPYVP